MPWPAKYISARSATSDRNAKSSNSWFTSAPLASTASVTSNPMVSKVSAIPIASFAVLSNEGSSVSKIPAPTFNKGDARRAGAALRLSITDTQRTSNALECQHHFKLWEFRKTIFDKSKTRLPSFRLIISHHKAVRQKNLHAGIGRLQIALQTASKRLVGDSSGRDRLRQRKSYAVSWIATAVER
ncbi:hypothetical protein GQR58_030476 [Nymphon striatum]|nr:hypothetical protein GQR58_030476 [Nymphon striatum]